VSLASEPLLNPFFFCFHFGTTKKIRSAYGLELTLLIFMTLYSVVVVGQGIISSCDELLIVFVAWGAATSTTQVELVSLERIGPGGGGQGHMVSPAYDPRLWCVAFCSQFAFSLSWAYR
jgi:hypothetical protein